MRQVTIGKAKISIPDSWEDVTLDRYSAALTALKQYEGNDRQAMAMAICGLCNLKEGVLLGMTRENVQQLRDGLSFFFETAPEAKLQMEFELGGQLYCLPTEIENATFGEFVDLDSTIMQHRDNLRDAMPGIMAIYCRPRNEPYLVPDLKQRTAERIKAFKEMPVELAEGVAAFFLTSAEHCRMLSEACTIQIAAAMASHLTLLNGHKTTRGFQRFISWPRVILSKCLWWNTRNAGASFISSTSRAKSRRPGKRMLKSKS